MENDANDTTRLIRDVFQWLLSAEHKSRTCRQPFGVFGRVPCVCGLTQLRERLYAARGAQPSAKNERDWRDRMTEEINERNATEVAAAQQPSAPTPEQQTETGGKWTWARRAANEAADEAKRMGLNLSASDMQRFEFEIARMIERHGNAALAAKDEQLAKFTTASPSKTDWCPLCKQGWDCAKEDQQSRVELHTLREQLRVMRDAIERFFQWASADAIPNDWPRDNEGDPILPAELLRRALASAPAARKQESAPAAEQDALTNRELGGKLVRETWIAWAKEQPNPKASWLVQWDELSEPDKEVDRRIWTACVTPQRENAKHLLESVIELFAARLSAQEKLESDVETAMQEELDAIADILGLEVYGYDEITAKVKELVAAQEKPVAQPNYWQMKSPIEDAVLLMGSLDNALAQLPLHFKDDVPDYVRKAYSEDQQRIHRTIAALRERWSHVLEKPVAASVEEIALQQTADAFTVHANTIRRWSTKDRDTIYISRGELRERFEAVIRAALASASSPLAEK